MDNLEDIIVPIIFGIVFLLQAIFGRKKPNDEADDAPTTSDDPSDQFRKIREEIQRRVEENRRKSEGEGSPSQSQPSGSSPQRIPTMRPATAASKPVQQALPRQAVSYEISGAERMRQMQIQIEEARKRAKQEEARAAAIRRDTEERARVYGNYSFRPSTREPTSALIDGVISDLHDPARARRALIFSEVFGAPVAFRNSGGSRPLWEN